MIAGARWMLLEAFPVFGQMQQTWRSSETHLRAASVDLGVE